MATLQKIRNRAGLLIIVVGVALFAFIIGDGLRSGSSILQDNKMVALNVDGNKIKYDEYQQLLSTRTAMYEQQGRSLSDRDRAEISNQLAQELISEYVLQEEASNLGLKVTSDELSALIYGQGVAPSQYAMQFFSQFGIDPSDPVQVQNIMAELDLKKIETLPAEQQGMMMNVRAQWLDVEKNIRNQRTAEKFNALMTRSYAINSLDQKYTLGQGTRAVAVVRTPSTILADDQVKVTDEDVKAYYDSHKEMFRFPFEQAQISYISTQILPSEADYAAAKAKVDKARQELLAAADASVIVRNYDNGFASDFYFTDKELDQALSSLPNVMTVMRDGAVGDVNEPMIINDQYTLVKLLARKSAPEEVKLNVLTLDSLNAAKSDSIVRAIQTGTSTFAAMVEAYSSDERTRATKGFVVNADPYTGMADSTFTQSQIFGMGLDTLNKVPVGQIVKLEQAGRITLLRAVEPTAAVNHYKVAQLSVPINFSEKTYQDRFAVINNVFASDKPFADMIADAEKAGLSVVKDEFISSTSSQLAAVADSHEIVSWALRSKDGAISDKLFRCGDDYLVIAQVDKKIPAGYRPFDQVKQQVRDRVTMEKRGEQLAANLKAKNLTSLAAYATEMKSTIDTLSSISYVTAPSTPATLIGVAMTTPLGKVSAPFRAETEVIVAQPISEDKEAQLSSSPAVLAQQRRAYGQQMAYMALQELMNKTKIEDTRYRFW